MRCGEAEEERGSGAGAALLSPLLPARRSPVPGLAGPAGWRWAFVTHYPSSPSDDTFTASRTGLPPARQPRSLAGGRPGSASGCAGADGLGGVVVVTGCSPGTPNPTCTLGWVGNGGSLCPGSGCPCTQGAGMGPAAGTGAAWAGYRQGRSGGQGHPHRPRHPPRSPQRPGSC